MGPVGRPVVAGGLSTVELQVASGLTALRLQNPEYLERTG